MKRKPLPNLSTLNELLNYDAATGFLSFRPRTKEMAKALGVSEKGVAAWNARYAGRTITNSVGDGYVCVTIRGQKYPAHRIVWKLVTGEDPATIDHIDGDKTNNRAENLRDVTESENQRNRKLNSNNSSGVPGVRIVSTGKWIARISEFGQTTALGTFTTKTEAVMARRKAEAERGFHQNHGRVTA